MIFIKLISTILKSFIATDLRVAVAMLSHKATSHWLNDPRKHDQQITNHRGVMQLMDSYWLQSLTVQVAEQSC